MILKQLKIPIKWDARIHGILVVPPILAMLGWGSVCLDPKWKWGPMPMILVAISMVIVLLLMQAKRNSAYLLWGISVFAVIGWAYFQSGYDYATAKGYATPASPLLSFLLVMMGFGLAGQQSRSGSGKKLSQSDDER